MKEPHDSRPRRSRAVGLLLALIAAFAFAPALRADSVDDEIKAMKALDAAGKEDECVAKIDALKTGADKRALAAFQQLAASKSDKVACAAIRASVGWQDSDFFRWLVGKIDDKEMYAPKTGRPEVYKCVLEAVRGYPPDKVKAALKPLGGVVARSLAAEPEFADRAIRAYGTVLDRFTVVQLLDWLVLAEAPAAGPARESKDKSKKAVLETLTQVCGKEFGDAASWKKWWDENGKTFKFPEPAKPGAPRAAGPAQPAAPIADPSELAEFKDDAYGWSVKRPEGDDWKFFKPDYVGPRVGLLFGTESFSAARAYFRIHDPAKNDPKDIKAFAAWVIDGCFKQELPPDGIIKAPETKIVTLGGVEWTVVSARGLAAGNKAFWGSMERRFYFAKLDPYIFYVDAYVRLSAEAEDKEAFWKCIESIALPAKK